jgi:SPP1 gp7 family putative phage head morphogenesis protein
MFKIDLASRVRRPSRRPITLANIAPTQAQAGDLAALYLRIVAAWLVGIPRIVAEYERTLAAMTTDEGLKPDDRGLKPPLITDSPSDVQGSIDDVAAEINRLVLSLTPDLRRWALQVERVQRGKWVRSVLSATDIDLDTILTAGDVDDTVGASIEWNVALIKDVDAELRRRISNAVFAGFQRRAPAAEIAKEIREATGMARDRSRRIAADQTVKLGARLNRARQEQAGLTSFKWRHSGKVHPRSWHLARNGHVYRWANPGIPADDMPGVPPWCGCVAQGVVTFDD